ncbi:hypothetical protein DL96DRAFT_1566067 [Flagelloscypha sp. PMI_526]|nr:hypothetical protein DL96DRAFT_1566067 [Flagelloscypha sp. PMI_526]
MANLPPDSSAAFFMAAPHLGSSHSSTSGRVVPGQQLEHEKPTRPLPRGLHQGMYEQVTNAIGVTQERSKSGFMMKSHDQRALLLEHRRGGGTRIWNGLGVILRFFNSPRKLDTTLFIHFIPMRPYQ